MEPHRQVERRLKVTVRYFALLREAVGKDSESVELEGEDWTVRGLLGSLARRDGRLKGMFSLPSLLCAVNMEYVDGDTPLADGDEVALFPPVSGG